MAARRMPDSLRALGRRSLPERVRLPDGEYGLIRVFKHDFFAATGLYDGPGGPVVVKFGRRGDFLGLPTGWIGTLLTRHEAGHYRRLAGIPGIPAFRGNPTKDAFAHTYVAGHALGRGERVNDRFFDELAGTLSRLHQLATAYVDLEKPENVLVGDDGRPYLIDFQIAWYWPRRLGGDLWPLSWIRGRLQAADHYHLLKLRRRCRPDQLSELDLARLARKPWLVRLHRKLIHPFQRLRRTTLSRLDPQRKPGERGRIEPTGRPESA